MNQTELSEALHVSQSTLSNWENDRVKIDSNSLRQIAAFFGVTIDYVLGDDGIPPHRGVKIPVLGTIRAGIPVAAIEDIEDWEEITDDMAKTGEFVALRVRGESMEPKISDGDVAIIRRQETIENGEIAVVLVNGEDATIKKIKITESGIILIGFNSDVYEPHFYSCEEIASLPVRIYGRLVEIRRKF